jgi:hypothetical protein
VLLLLRMEVVKTERSGENDVTLRDVGAWHLCSLTKTCTCSYHSPASLSLAAAEQSGKRCFQRILL